MLVLSDFQVLNVPQAFEILKVKLLGPLSVGTANDFSWWSAISLLIPNRNKMDLILYTLYNASCQVKVQKEQYFTTMYIAVILQYYCTEWRHV